MRAGDASCGIHRPHAACHHFPQPSQGNQYTSYHRADHIAFYFLALLSGIFRFNISIPVPTSAPTLRLSRRATTTHKKRHQRLLADPRCMFKVCRNKNYCRAIRYFVFDKCRLGRGVGFGGPRLPVELLSLSSVMSCSRRCLVSPRHPT